jgi:hypothetical protein
MAGSKHVHSDDKGKVRVRFMEVEIEGSNQTLLEGIRHITSAMPSQVVVRQVGAKAATPRLVNGGTGAEGGTSEDAADSDALEAEEGIAEGVQTNDTPSSAPRKPRTSPKAPALATNLRQDESPTLAEFSKQANLSKDAGDKDRVVVVATWLKETRGIAAFGASEFYTCCRLMDWTLPSDLTSPMRNLKKQKKLDSADAGQWFLTLLGEKHFTSLKNGA